MQPHPKALAATRRNHPRAVNHHMKSSAREERRKVNEIAAGVSIRLVIKGYPGVRGLGNRRAFGLSLYHVTAAKIEPPRMFCNPPCQRTEGPFGRCGGADLIVGDALLSAVSLAGVWGGRREPEEAPGGQSLPLAEATS